MTIIVPVIAIVAYLLSFIIGACFFRKSKQGPRMLLAGTLGVIWGTLEILLNGSTLFVTISSRWFVDHIATFIGGAVVVMSILVLIGARKQKRSPNQVPENTSRKLADPQH